MAIILGLDPGSRKAGYGLIEMKSGQIRHLHHGTIKLNEKQPMSERLSQLYSELMQLFAQFKIDHVSVENMFLGKNPSSAFKLGQARGVCLLAAGKNRAQVFEYAPRRVKLMITGSGGAQKNQVRLLCLRHLAINSSEGEDATDALALALCHVFENKFLFSNNAPGECEL